MLPVDRRKKIRELLLEKKTVKISTLSKYLGVSEMTVHRDIKPLVKEGFLIKTFGGVTLAERPAQTENRSDTCAYCAKRVDHRLAFRLIRSNNRVETACCAHCGLLRHHQLRDEITQAICQDFLLQTTVSAASCWYVMETSLTVGCCQPQVLTFEQREHAEKFITGFSGVVLPFSEAMTALLNKMHLCHKTGGEKTK